MVNGPLNTLTIASKNRLKNPRGLSINAYRGLLSRGREGVLVLFPPIRKNWGFIPMLKADRLQSIRLK